MATDSVNLPADLPDDPRDALIVIDHSDAETPDSGPNRSDTHADLAQAFQSDGWQSRKNPAQESGLNRPDGNLDQDDRPPDGGAEVGTVDDDRRRYRDELSQSLSRTDPVPVAEVPEPGTATSDSEADTPPIPDPTMLFTLGAVGAREILRRRSGRSGQATDD